MLRVKEMWQQSKKFKNKSFYSFVENSLINSFIASFFFIPNHCRSCDMTEIFKSAGVKTLMGD